MFLTNAGVVVCVFSITVFLRKTVRRRNLHLRLSLKAVRSKTPIRFRLSKKRETFLLEQQVSDLCYQISSGLRSGQSMFQALDDASKNIPSPLGAVIAKVIAKFEAGTPLVHALIECSCEQNCSELSQIARVLRLVDHLGSDPGIALDRAAKAAESRLESRALLESKLAEARLSALIVSAMPLVLAVGGLWLRPDLVNQSLKSPLGKAAYSLGATLWSIGTIVIWRLSHPSWI